MSEQIAVEIVKVIPTTLAILIVGGILFYFRKHLKWELFRISSFKAFGIEISFFEKQLESAANKPANTMGSTGLDEATTLRHITINKDDRLRLFKRLNRIAPFAAGAHVLWVDDNPEYNFPEIAILHSLGVYVLQVTNTQDALQHFANRKYDLIISDMSRFKVDNEGLIFLAKLHEKDKTYRLIFYVGMLDKSKGVPGYSFGITNRPDELLHLVADVFERDRS